ncbi:exportin-5-like [Plakobranchus ocellatus]|uniref:Exportin-5-like n=1 Tax=Plakobranchus ocellatus TaxID=259542 RepID=A0AAV3YJE6_9GAST|nr:exportin-5-like [Plakobranchus ocellatus]
MIILSRPPPPVFFSHQHPDLLFLTTSSSSLSPAPSHPPSLPTSTAPLLPLKPTIAATMSDLGTLPIERGHGHQSYEGLVIHSEHVEILFTVDWIVRQNIPQLIPSQQLGSNNGEDIFNESRMALITGLETKIKLLTRGRNKSSFVLLIAHIRISGRICIKVSEVFIVCQELLEPKGRECSDLKFMV